jgi:hypothetical protein
MKAEALMFGSVKYKYPLGMCGARRRLPKVYFWSLSGVGARGVSLGIIIPW